MWIQGLFSQTVYITVQNDMLYFFCRLCCIIMEEILTNLFVQCALPNKINWDLWRIIQQQTAADFQHEQSQIYQFIMGKPTLKEKYFQQFQQNHLNLYGWSLLVSREKADIEPYLFRPVLHRTPSFHNSKLNNALQGYSIRNSQTEPTEKKKILPPVYQRKEEPDMGGRELYLQTFEACRGQRYIPYDYVRHVRGGNERAQYNAFIRQKHNRNHSNPVTPRNSLSHFAEWESAKEKTSLLTFRNVLRNNSLNSQIGLQTMLKRHGSRKLVFVNHQRKPVNYYLRSQLKKGGQ